MEIKLRGAFRELIIILALAAATWAAYWPARGHDFVQYDDEWYVSKNEHVIGGLSVENMKWAFSTTAGGNWHPLTWLSHMLDVELFGVNAAGHHMMGVAIHVLNVIVLFLLLRLMTAAPWLSACVAGAFALHPLRVESVAWIAERKDVLSALFGFLTIWAYAAFVRQMNWMRYALVVAMYALSLASKAMFVTLPFLLLLLDFWPLRRIGSTEVPADGAGGSKPAIKSGPGWRWPIAPRLILEKLPLLAMAVVVSLVTFIAQRNAGSMDAMARLAPQPEGADAAAVDAADPAVSGSMVSLSFTQRFSNALVTYPRYVGKIFWPVDLAVLYPHPEHWATSAVIGSAALLLLVTIVSLASARRHPYLLVGWLWFVGTLVPVIGLVQVGLQSMADRYTYVPSVGIFIAGSWMTVALVGRTRWLLLSIAGAAILVALWIGTREQLQHWASTKTLYQRAVDVTDDNYVMNMYLALIMEQEGRFDVAARHFREAARIRSNDPIVQFKVADVLIRLGEIKEALVYLRRVLALAPDQVEAMNNLAWLLATYSDPAVRRGEEAVTLARRACALTNFQSPDYLDTLAVALAETGNFSEAIKVAEQARDRAIAVGRPVQDIEQHIQLFRDEKSVRTGW